jgi:deoxyribodipyrimidine photolyase-related protein
MAKLRLILGDQLNQKISSLSDCDRDNDVILMCEVWDETKYVKHHKKKIAFLFSAMRHFANELKENGFTVHYTQLSNDTQNFEGEIGKAIAQYNVDEIICTEPSEYRVLHNMQKWPDQFDINVDIRDDDRFLATHVEFQKWAKDRKELRMEFFYREMRKKHKILMDGDQPIGGKWNYDADNRQAPDETLDIPAPYQGKIDTCTRQVMDLVANKFDDHFGNLDPFYFAVTRGQALYVLDKFINERLGNFGTYQDAMIEGEPWMYHSHISFYLNCGLLLPMEIIERAESAYHSGHAPLNAVEGFIRQILGWREFVRGIYWLKMPEYETLNALNATRQLPEFFWTADTKMNCMRQCISETQENAYAHHIQRLMVLGNFSLIAGLDIQQVNEWYLIVYADAYQWVELPNVSGMILYADGGYLASKPYAASGAYINRMSNYCKNCEYSVTKKSGDDACPFNYLYWDFFDRNIDTLKGNPRLNNPYATLSRMKDDKITAAKQSAKAFFKKMENDEKV